MTQSILRPLFLHVDFIVPFCGRMSSSVGGGGGANGKKVNDGVARTRDDRLR